MIYPLQDRFDGWRRQPREGLIRLVLLDIDGCLTAGEAAPLDFGVLARLQELNLLATRDPTVPGLALCTGRPEPYVELLTQAIGGYLPAIWENGAGLYLPAEYRFALNPLLGTARLAAFEQVRRLVAETLVVPGLADRQPGKECSISLYPTANTSLEQLSRLARTAIEPLSEHYWVQTGLTCVEVLPVGVHKGSGARWLLGLLGLAPEQVLGIGDAPGDLEFLRVAALGATPANGAPQVKAAAHFVAELADSAGVLEILDWCIERNRSVLQRP